MAAEPPAPDRHFQADAVASFEDLEREFAARRLPPVATWQPAHHGRIDIRIARDGTWYHEGGRIRRPELVRVFASILRLDPDGYVLVTPAERLSIEVEDTPFVAIDCAVRGSGRNADLMFTTNAGDRVPADATRPVAMRAPPRDSLAFEPGFEPGLEPCVTVRAPGGSALLARILPAVWYRLAEVVVEEGDRFVLYSSGAAFDLGARR